MKSSYHRLKRYAFTVKLLFAPALRFLLARGTDDSSLMGWVTMVLSYNTKPTCCFKRFKICMHSARAKKVQNTPSEADFYKLLLVLIVIARKQEQGKVQAPIPLH